MYLLSYFEDRGFIEASLGGKITASELEVFEEELLSIIDGLEGKPYNLMLDYSRAKGLDDQGQNLIKEIRNKCQGCGAQRIVSVVPGQADLERETAHRLEAVISGHEDYVLDPAYARFTSLTRTAVVLRAA